MKTLFDTSVIIAALVDEHKSHARSLLWLQQAQRGEFSAVISSHSIAELYAILTRLPLRPLISGPLAWRLINGQVLPYFEAIPLNSADYQAVISYLSGAALIGGITYDAIIAQAAIKSSAERILTLNPKDFLRTYPALAAEIITP